MSRPGLGRGVLTFPAPLLLVALFLAAPASGRAQDSVPPPDRRVEARLLRRAAASEAAGDYAAAERALRGLLESDPASPGALFALERVLRAQGRPEDVLGAVDAYLEVDPTASEARYLQLRILAEVDSLDALKAAGRAWIEVDPRSSEPYRLVARTFEGAFGPEQALEVLRKARRALGDSTALAREMGDVLLRLDRPDEAVGEWSLALGDDAVGLASISRRIMSLGETRAPVADALAERLAADPTTVARLRAGARLAADPGLDERALELARSVVPGLEDRAAAGFLVDLARRAESGGADRAALWAYRTARDRTQNPGEAGALDERIARTALALGDTAMALEARERRGQSLPEGSSERRRALAASLELRVETGDLDGARERLKPFREEFPDAPELDAISADLAAALLARGRSQPARDVLEGVQGPRSSRERAYLALARGEVKPAMDDLAGSLPGLEPAAATETLQLLALLDGLSEDARPLGARVAALSHQGSTDQALTALEEGLDGLEDSDQPPLLAMGARLARESGMDDRAARLRERLIEDFPDAVETPEAMLRQAQWHAERGAGPARARELLERLIIDRPESPVVPAARRELARLKGGAG